MNLKTIIFSYLSLISFFLFCFIGISMTLSCKTTPGKKEIPSIFSIYQDGVITEIRSNKNEYSIKKKSFSLRFLLNKEENKGEKTGMLYAPYFADNYYSFKPGTETSTLSIFSDNGFEIPEQWGTETIFIDDSSYHKIEMGKKSGRLKELETDSSMIYLEWSITEMDRKGGKYKIEEFPWDAIYLIFYIDQNNDNIIDEKELFKMILKLE